MKTPEIRFSFPNVWIDGEIVGLRKKEFQLLQYLYEHRGEVQRPYDIYIDVWMFPVSVVRISSNSAIATVISRLRRKIPEAMIGTVPRLGWVLV